MNTQDLKTNVWNRTEGKSLISYDETLDTVFIYFTETETERIITHFVDNNVALLFRHSDKEIVGIRVEYFESEFLPRLVENNGWKLSETGEKLDGNVDLNFKAIEIQKAVTRPLTATMEQLTIPKLKKKLRFERVRA